MRKSLSALIFWGQLRPESFLYGTKLKYRAKDWIEFENEWVPAGKSLHSWYSKTIYQKLREAPQLPILKAGKAYYLKAHLKAVPEGSLYFKILYYNRFEKLIGDEVIRSSKESFTPPEEMYAYNIELINAGCQSFTFNAIEIIEAEVTAEHNFSMTYSIVKGPADDSSKFLNVILVEPNQYSRNSLDFSELEFLKNIHLITTSAYLAHGFVTKEFETILETLLEEALAKGQVLNLISYAPIGNYAVLHHVSKEPLIHGYITNDLHTNNFYQESFAVYHPAKDLLNHSQMYQMMNNKRIHLYSLRLEYDYPMSLAMTLTDKSLALNALQEIRELESR